MHKLRIVQKELNETEVWLKVMIRAGFATEDPLQELREETKSLARIITASVRTRKERGVGQERKPRLPIVDCRPAGKTSGILPEGVLRTK